MERAFSLRPTRALFAAALAAWAAAPLEAHVGTSGWTERMSFASDGTELTFDAREPSASGSGRWVAYTTATPLLPDDTNGVPDVYVYDRFQGTLVCASTNMAGDYGNNTSQNASMSEDGRWVAFITAATNLGGIDANDRVDVYLRDLSTGEMFLVSKPSGGTGSSNGHSLYPSVSAHGRYVAFQSNSTNLIPGDTNGALDVFVYDRETNTQARAGVGWNGGEPNGDSRNPSISSDGRRVAYHSEATNLLIADGNGALDVFVHDFDSGGTLLVSTTQAFEIGNADSYLATLSSDGTKVAFRSQATNFDPRDTDPLSDVYHKDLSTGAIELVSVTYLGGPDVSGSEHARIARNGRFVAFSTEGQMLSKFTGFREVYVRDVLLNKTWLASRPDGAITLSNDHSFDACLSADGGEVFFSSWGRFDPSDTNGLRDIYVRTMIPDPIEYCDAEQTADGCIPGVGRFGFPSARLDSGFTLYADSVPRGRPGLLFYGFKGSAEIPFQGGVLCLAGPIHRSIVLTSSNVGIHACDGRISIDMNAFAAGALGGNPHALLSVPGHRVNAQFWGRDNVGGDGSFLTDAMQYVVGP